MTVEIVEIVEIAEIEIAVGVQDHLSTEALDVTTKWTGILRVATIERGSAKTDTRIGAMIADGTETEDHPGGTLEGMMTALRAETVTCSMTGAAAARESEKGLEDGRSGRGPPAHLRRRRNQRQILPISSLSWSENAA